MDFNHWLQSRLTAHGFSVGGIDGVIGPTTLKALAAFQAARSLPVTRQADDRTTAALRLQASAVSDADKAVIGDIDKPKPASQLPSIVAPVWPRQSGVPAYFGAVGTRQVGIDPGYGMVLAWDTDTAVKKITVHELVAPAASRALAKIAGIYSKQDRRALGLDLFGGSLNVRRMRGGSAYSMHSWGIAIDFDPARNGLTTRAPAARLSHDDAKPFWQAWKDEGALPLGEAIGRDYMHVQFARL